MSAATSTRHWRRGVGLLSLVTIAIGAANYLVSLVAVHLLPADEFAAFAAGQGLLLVLGTGSLAALPWAVARHMARSTDPHAAAQAMQFGLVGSALQALVLAPVALVVCWSIDGPLFGLAGGLATVVISLLAGPIGFLQGREDLAGIAAVRSVETIVRLSITMGVLFTLTRSAGVAMLAFPIGSVAALGYALHRGRAGFPLRRLPRATALRLSWDAASLGGIQVLLAMLGALDSVYVTVGHIGAQDAASYQAAALLARIPLFFSAAVATAAYTAMTAAPTEPLAGTQLRSALRTYLWLSVPFLIAYLTMPASVLHLVIPAQYDQTLPTLRLLCFAGVFVGLINVLTTAHQARGRFGRCLVILGVAVLVQGGVLGALAALGRLSAFAAAVSVVAAAAAVALGYDARLWLRGHLRGHHRVHAVTRAQLIVAGAAGAAVVAVAANSAPAWVLALLVVAGGSVAIAFRPAVPAEAGGHSLPTESVPSVVEPARPSRPRPSRPRPAASGAGAVLASSHPLLEELSR